MNLGQLIQITSQKALSWLDHNSKYFDPFLFRKEPTESIQTALAELGLLLFILKNRKNKKIMNVSECISNEFSLEKKMLLICRRHDQIDYCLRTPPEAFTLPAIIRLNLDDEEAEKLGIIRKKIIIVLKEQEQITSNIPWKKYEAGFFLTQFGEHSKVLAEIDLYLQNIASNVDKLMEWTRIDVYEFIHKIAYRTQFGLRNLTRNKFLNLNEILDKLTIWLIENNDLDLLGEILIAWNCSVMNYSETVPEPYRKAWHILHDKQKNNGAFDTHQDITSMVFGLEAERIFLSVYHKPLVTALAGATIPAWL